MFSIQYGAIKPLLPFKAETQGFFVQYKSQNNIEIKKLHSISFCQHKYPVSALGII